MKKIILNLMFFGQVLCLIPIVDIGNADNINNTLLAIKIGDNVELPPKVRSNFSNASCLVVIDLSDSDQAKGAPWNSAKLYQIKSTCNKDKVKEYILKEMSVSAQEKEIKRLTACTTGTPGSTAKKFENQYINKFDSRLNFIYPVLFISYIDKSNKKHVLSLMPKAHGIQLIEIIKDFKHIKNDPRFRNLVCNAYYNLGKQISKFYIKNKEADKASEPLKHYSIRHGDFHAGNIFVDLDHGKVSLIDNETVSDSFMRSTDIAKDIAFLFLKSFFVLKWTFPEVIRDYPFNDFFEISLPSFIGGYLSRYPRDEALQQFNIIINSLKTYQSEKDPELGLFYYNKKVLGISLDSIIEPIINKLENWLRSYPLVHKNIGVNDPIDHSGKTSLHKASELERLVMCPLILAGADVNAKDSNGNTPLHEAAYYNKPKAFNLLIENGADKTISNLEGHSVLKKAIDGHAQSIKDLLEK